MKKLILTILLFPIINFAQYDISAGMGINLSSKSSLKDYINVNFSSPGNDVKSFETEAEFFGEIDRSITSTFDIGIEYSASVYSFTNNISIFGVYDFSVVEHKPSVVGYYVIKGEGYKFKFGGGLGLRIVNATEKLPNTIYESKYSSMGFGILARAYGMTGLGGNLYAYIGADARLDLPGEISDGGGTKLIDMSAKENVNLNSLSIGIKLGIVYSF